MIDSFKMRFVAGRVALISLTGVFVIMKYEEGQGPDAVPILWRGLVGQIFFFSLLAYLWFRWRSSRPASERQWGSLPTCPECGQASSSRMRRTFLGFTRLRCTVCSAASTLPLSANYRLAYWLGLGFPLACLLGIFGTVSTPLSGWLIGGAGLALYRDSKLRKRSEATSA